TGPRSAVRSGASTRPAASGGPSRCWHPAGSSSRDILARVPFSLLLDLLQDSVVLLGPIRREGTGASPQSLAPWPRSRDGPYGDLDLLTVRNPRVFVQLDRPAVDDALNLPHHIADSSCFGSPSWAPCRIH